MSGLNQKTIKNSFSLKGVGLHTGKEVLLTVKPAQPNSGIIFKRIDIERYEKIAVEDENKCLIVGPIFVELTEEGKIRRLRDKIRKNGLTININQ